MSLVKIHFLGAAKTVTGSKFYIETPQKNILIDCGMFQGIKELRELNWKPFPMDTSVIDTVLLTHGHLDHTGYLPRLVKQGFRGDIIGTAPTLAITEIILRDSAKIHEEEADKANKERYSKHDPALPFYTLKDAEKTLQYFKTKEKDNWISLSDDIEYRFRYNGHIIGACFIELNLFEKTLVFSGDIGRPDDVLLQAPEKPTWVDFLFMESTYGNKLHPDQDVEEKLIQLINETLYKRGTLIIPSFAVERLQTLMYLLWKLYQKNKIPNIPIFVDSPMGNNVLSVFEQFPDWHKLPMKDYYAICNHINIVTSYKETWETIDDPRPKIVIAGSGMVTGGRVLTYLKQLIDITTTSVLLVGYQAEGTRGRQLQDGAHEIKLYGKYYPVKAQIHHIESLSAHADQYELLDWVSKIKNIPEKVFLIHGEPSASEAFNIKLRDTFNWNIHIPKLNEVQEIII
ncbi:MBL fold metallo-hydrolase [uncultured Aquimarina sp.]|uniref:MBL fold metallo-hydrolase RNA specificity domain-containing protein n=1 Tax=uncultured Aquimarina sp. TaxID=575652 RepID=UPI00261BC9EC|nr:MBL fold metallo-hydrolase [uncultured Aquimarina sp.]